MISLQLIEEEQGNVRLSLLGRACGRSALSFRSCMRLVDLLREFGSSATPRDIMVIIQCLADVDEGTYMPLNARINAEKSRPRQLAVRIGERLVRLLQRFVNEDKDYLRRCKRTLALLDWIDGVSHCRFCSASTSAAPSMPTTISPSRASSLPILPSDQTR
jgi:helicase